MGYLIENDYKKQIRDEVLDMIQQENPLIRVESENAAIAEMIQYLSLRYDTTLIFIDVLEWNNSDTFNENQQIWIDDAGTVKLFYAVVANTNIDPLTDDGTNWLPGDLRNSVVKMYAIDIALYHLHSNIAYQQMPKTREDRYKMAIAWLKDLRDGKLNDDSLPLKEDEEGNTTGGLIFSGGHDKRDDSY